MGWTFPGITNPVECTYTQTLGFTPDVALLSANYQSSGSIPAAGDLTLTYEASSIVLPDCVVDLASVRVSTGGHYITLKVLDRRILWSRYPPISGEYNIVRAGVKVRQKTLRQLGTILMTALGEASADVSALPTNIYPAVSWRCDNPVEAAEALFSEFGYSVALGFGSEAVTVVKLGTGATLSTTDAAVVSATIDDKFTPRYVRNCFADSAAQVRLILEAVGLDTDGTWKPIDDLSFAPAGGWVDVPPFSLLGAADALTDDQKKDAQAYVRRAYRVKGFADDTWNIPDGSGVTSLVNILPLDGRLLETEDLRDDDSYVPYRVYGKYWTEADEKAQPPVAEGNSLVGDIVKGRQYHLDRENGVLLFEEPIFYVGPIDGLPERYKGFHAAELWLEVTIGIRDPFTGSLNHYEYDIEVNPGGFGYVTVEHEERAETIVEYDEEHAVTGFTVNTTTLNAVGTAAAAAVTGAYATTASQFVAYNQPKFALRCDGAIQQIQHIITAGENEHAVNRTTAARNFEFDRGIPSRAQRSAHLRAIKAGAYEKKTTVKLSRQREFND